MQRKGGSYASLPISKASLDRRDRTGRVVSALPRLALTSLIGSGRHHTAADVNIGTIPLAAGR
jgi:hypothetical protein